MQDVLKRHATLTNSVSTILEDFGDRITSLSENVSTLYSKTNVIQKEQQSNSFKLNFCKPNFNKLL